MTTATATTTKVHRDSGLRVLARTAVVALVAGAVVATVAAVVSGSAAASGAIVGTLVCIGVFGFGLISLDVVATVMPMASLMVAMTTYTFQVLLMALVFTALDTSGALDSTLDRHWLAGTIIAGTACWLVAQVVLTSRRRIPVFDLPATTPPDRSEVGER